MASLFFGAFPGNECLCVVKCLSAYESATAELQTVDGGVNQLFISYTRPHRPITSQRIAHWIKDLLSDAGVNTDVFKAHSVRGASTSAAMNVGNPLDYEPPHPLLTLYLFLLARDIMFN